MMNNRVSILFATLILLVVNNKSFSQEGTYVTTSDFETWTRAGINLKFNKNLQLGLEEQLRLKSNSSEIDAYFTQIHAKYKTKFDLEIGGGLRYIRENDTEGKIQGYETHFRYNLDLAYSHKIDRFKLKYRIRYQNRNELGVDELAGDYAISKWRLKASVSYNIRKWKFDPTFSAEIFRRSQETTTSEFERLRMTLGTKYDLKKFGEIKGFYRIEKELNTTYPKTTHIWGLAYVYTLKIKTNGN